MLSRCLFPRYLLNFWSKPLVSLQNSILQSGITYRNIHICTTSKGQWPPAPLVSPAKKTGFQLMSRSHLVIVREMRKGCQNSAKIWKSSSSKHHHQSKIEQNQNILWNTLEQRFSFYMQKKSSQKGWVTSFCICTVPQMQATNRGTPLLQCFDGCD